MMRWTVRLEARTDEGEVKTTELVAFGRPAMARTLAEIGLALAEAKALLTKLQASMLRDQVAEYAARSQVCPGCGCSGPSRTGARADCRPCSARSRSRRRGSRRAAVA
jgi:hypothetical protein